MGSIDVRAVHDRAEHDPVFRVIRFGEPEELDAEWRLGLLSWFKDEPVYRIGDAFDVSDTTSLRAQKFAAGDLEGFAYVLVQFEREHDAPEVVVAWTDAPRRTVDGIVEFVNRSFDRLRAIRDARRAGVPVPLLSPEAQALEARIADPDAPTDRDGDPLGGFVPSKLSRFARDEVGIVLASAVAKWQVWAPGWLVETGSKRGFSALRDVFEQPVGPASMKIRAGWALAELHHDDAGYRALAGFATSKWAEDRSLVAQLLARVPQPEADEPLLELTGDADPLVRYVAYEALCLRHGLPSAGDIAQCRLRILHIRHQSRCPAVAARATAEIRDLFRRLRAGEPANALGLDVRGGSAEARAVEASMRLPHGEGGRFPEHYDLDALALLNSGIDREWAGTAILSLLEQGDPRAPEGLCVLGGREWLADLVAMRDGVDPALHATVDAAIDALRE